MKLVDMLDIVGGEDGAVVAGDLGWDVSNTTNGLEGRWKTEGTW
jgi:hypothetical protein